MLKMKFCCQHAEDSDFEWNKGAEEDSNVTFEEELERKISLLVKDKKV